MKKYPKYKDSGVEWLGEVPEGWNIIRARHLLNLHFSNVDKKSEDFEMPVLLCNYVDVYKNEFIDKSISFMSATAQKNEFEKFQIKVGDILLTKDSEDPMDIAIPALVIEDFENVLCGYHLAQIRPNQEILSSRYLFRLFQAKNFNIHFQRLASGMTRYGLSIEAFKSVKILLPTLLEQISIATYLDQATAHLDRFIALRQQQCALLKEQRAALIQQAVTKGIRPGVTMKDSGVEWIGEVPEEWEVTRIKFLLNGIIDTEHKTVEFIEDGEYMVVRTSNVKNGRIEFENAKYTDHKGFIEWTRRGVPRPGDILLTREAPAGEACIVPEGLPLCLGQRMVWLKVKEDKLVPFFYLSMIYSSVVQEYIEQLSSGSVVSHFNMSDIKNMPVLAPPIYEQQEIVEYITHETAELDLLTQKYQRQIELVQEYRTSLIAAAVTGKIDVRENQN